MTAKFVLNRKMRNEMKLPAEFMEFHDYCVFLHDVLSSLIMAAEKANLFTVNVRFRDEAEMEDFENSSGDIGDWLTANGRKNEWKDIIYRNVMKSLVADFCHFVFEGLRASGKGKLTVAYALLRKPLKQNLLYLEWMLADRNSFIDKFITHADWSKFAAKQVEESETERRRLIEGAIQQTSAPQLFSADFIYETRYDKNADHSLASFFDQATHLITTTKAIKTANMNFNFIFSQEDAFHSQWYHLYWRLPVILNYAIEVIEALLFTFVPHDTNEIDITDIRRKVGLADWAVGHPMKGEPLNLEAIRDAYLKKLPLRCRRCNEVPEYDSYTIDLILRKQKFRCPSCHTTTKIR